jgi:hypothetical protein
MCCALHLLLRVMKRGGIGTTFQTLESERPLFNSREASGLHVRTTASFDISLIMSYNTSMLTTKALIIPRQHFDPQ